MYRILFVCTGNICRSPTAEGIARALLVRERLADFFQFDSAGLAAGHVGEAPDTMAQMAARQRGYALHDLRARKFTMRDFEDFDVILGMDRDHVTQLRMRAPLEARDRVLLFGDMTSRVRGRSVPDPYGGSPEDFMAALDMIEAGCQDLVAALKEQRPDLA